MAKGIQRRRTFPRSRERRRFDRHPHQDRLRTIGLPRRTRFGDIVHTAIPGIILVAHPRGEESSGNVFAHLGLKNPEELLAKGPAGATYPFFNGERHQRTMDCAGEERRLTISRPLAEASDDTWLEAPINRPRHGAY
jgi:hypothetical protein